jgi:hypothetical protein
MYTHAPMYVHMYETPLRMYTSTHVHTYICIRFSAAVQKCEAHFQETSDVHALHISTLCNYGALLEHSLGKVDEAEVCVYVLL